MFNLLRRLIRIIFLKKIEKAHTSYFRRNKCLSDYTEPLALIAKDHPAKLTFFVSPQKNVGIWLNLFWKNT